MVSAQHKKTALIVAGVCLAAALIGALVWYAFLSNVNNTNNSDDAAPPKEFPPDRAPVREMVNETDDVNGTATDHSSKVYDSQKRQLTGQGPKRELFDHDYMNPVTLFPGKHVLPANRSEEARAKEESSFKEKLDEVARLERTLLSTLNALVEAIDAAVKTRDPLDIMQVMNLLTHLNNLRLIFTGEESAGKSFLLNAIMQRQLSYMDVLKATMQPVVTTLRYAPEGSEKFIFDGRRVAKFEDLIREMQAKFGEMQKHKSADGKYPLLVETELQIVIEAPFVNFPCTLVDLPGYVASEPENAAKVLDMINSYKNRPNSVFVVVAKADSHASTIDPKFLNALKDVPRDRKMIMMNRMSLLLQQDNKPESDAQILKNHFDKLDVVATDESTYPFLIFLKKDPELENSFLSAAESTERWDRCHRQSVEVQEKFMTKSGAFVSKLVGKASYPSSRLGMPAWKDAVMMKIAEAIGTALQSHVEQQERLSQQERHKLEENGGEGGDDDTKGSFVAAFHAYVDAFKTVIPLFLANAHSEIRELVDMGGGSFQETPAVLDERTSECVDFSMTEKDNTHKTTPGPEIQRLLLRRFDAPDENSTAHVAFGDMHSRESQKLGTFFLSRLPPSISDNEMMQDAPASTHDDWTCDHQIAQRLLVQYGKAMCDDVVVKRQVERNVCIGRRFGRAAHYSVSMKMRRKSSTLSSLIKKPEFKEYMDKKFDELLSEKRVESVEWLQGSVGNKFDGYKIQDRQLRTERHEMQKYFGDLKDDRDWPNITSHPRCYQRSPAPDPGPYTKEEVLQYGRDIAHVHYSAKALAMAKTAKELHDRVWSDAFTHKEMNAWADKIKAESSTDEQVTSRFDIADEFADAQELRRRLRKLTDNIREVSARLNAALPMIQSCIREMDPIKRSSKATEAASVPEPAETTPQETVARPEGGNRTSDAAKSQPAEASPPDEAVIAPEEATTAP